MVATFSHIFPVIAGVMVGYVLRKLGIAKQSDGEFLFILFIYVCVPALAFSSLSTVRMTRHLLLFPLTALCMTVLSLIASRLVARKSQLSAARGTTFVLACTIVNSAFAIPFAQALYGASGVSRVAAFDVANNIIVFGWIYSIAARANPEHRGNRQLVGKLIRIPPLYGVAAGLIVNASHLHVPDIVVNTSSTFGGATGLIVTLATGIMFAPGRTDFNLSARALAVRTVCGLAVGLTIIGLFDLQGMERTIALILSLSPVGFNCVTFSSLEQLDVTFAAGTLSVSLVMSLVMASAIAIAIG